MMRDETVWGLLALGVGVALVISVGHWILEWMMGW